MMCITPSIYFNMSVSLSRYTILYVSESVLVLLLLLYMYCIEVVRNQPINRLDSRTS